MPGHSPCSGAPLTCLSAARARKPARLLAQFGYALLCRLPARPPAAKPPPLLLMLFLLFLLVLLFLLFLLLFLFLLLLSLPLLLFLLMAVALAAVVFAGVREQ